MGFGDIGKKLSKLGRDTKNGVQKMSDSVSISNRITAEKRSLERLFASIGEAVYKESPDVPKAGLEDEWAAVKVAYANIAAYNEELNQVKGLFYCPNCGRPAAQGDKYCAKCGFRLDNLREGTGKKVAQDIKETGQEVGKLAGDAADKTGEMVGGAAADTKNFFFKMKTHKGGVFKNTKGKIKNKVTSADMEVDDFSTAPEVMKREEREAVERFAQDYAQDYAQAAEYEEKISGKDQSAEADQKTLKESAEAPAGTPAQAQAQNTEPVAPANESAESAAAAPEGAGMQMQGTADAVSDEAGNASVSTDASGSKDADESLGGEDSFFKPWDLDQDVHKRGSGFLAGDLSDEGFGAAPAEPAAPAGAEDDL